jgi:hypothetical protein
MARGYFGTNGPSLRLPLFMALSLDCGLHSTEWHGRSLLNPEGPRGPPRVKRVPQWMRAAASGC